MAEHRPLAEKVSVIRSSGARARSNREISMDKAIESARYARKFSTKQLIRRASAIEKYLDGDT